MWWGLLTRIFVFDEILDLAAEVRFYFDEPSISPLRCLFLNENADVLLRDLRPRGVLHGRIQPFWKRREVLHFHGHR